MYPEEADGESALWVDLGGVGGWLTTRSPLPGWTPLVLGVGYAHRLGEGRLAWRLHVFSGALGDRSMTFIYGDLISIERLLAVGRLRPWWRVALGFGLDLEGGDRFSLGDEGYFNTTSGAQGGLGLTAGAGVDAFITDGWFMRVELDARVHGGAGRTGVMGATHLGTGITF